MNAFLSILLAIPFNVFIVVSGWQQVDRHHRRRRTVRIPENVWRQAALEHEERVRKILQPGLVSFDHPLNAAHRKNREHPEPNEWTALDPKHPVYNFLIEYYGLKGIKGPKRLARWCPSLSLLLLQEETRIKTIADLEEASLSRYPKTGTRTSTQDDDEQQDFDILNGGILLEGATEDDFSSVLHLRGAEMMLDSDQQVNGVMYCPSLLFAKNEPDRQEENARLTTPFLWYKSILEQTLQAEPILHCHGLHEWAMQYHPEGTDPPPSAKYQQHLRLRVPREIINQTVERKGISCTHVDALRFFAPAAAPLNHHGSSLNRMDQLQLEQPACVHAHMDLLKIAIKLRPFCDPRLLVNVLEVALESRTLDVAASPYDATSYGVGVVPVETSEGRAEYTKRQKDLMARAEEVRRDLLFAYELFLPMAFSETSLQQGCNQPQAERL
ncbi:unnamed protein product [Cylindrotheca closterium]|uniref:Uncharacterized protein n=1 Tax=Cylindrotheca closterium TaxID=2856 RepID=A0AAD2CT29_9STRA|nr:unnamed protein product [Cylindrotheca closterium]